MTLSVPKVGLFLAASFWVVLSVSPVQAAPPAILTQDADVILRIQAGNFSGGRLEAGGDYNGDGYDDIVFYENEEIQVVLGGNLPHDSLLSERVVTRIPTLGNAYLRVTAIDVDGDGYDDFVVHNPFNSSSSPDCRVIYGRQILPAQFDLNSPDLLFVGQANSNFGRSLATGDIDGDGRVELLIGAPLADAAGRSQAGEAYLIRGVVGRRLGTLDVRTSTEVITFQGPTASPYSPFAVGKLGRWVGIGEISGDEKGEVFLASPYATSLQGEIYVIQGQEWGAFSSAWNLATSSASLTLLVSRGTSGCGVSDMDGDDRAELFISTGSESQNLALVKGDDLQAVLLSISPVIDLQPTSPTPHVPLPVGMSKFLPVFGDFDGEGEKDLFFTNFVSNTLPNRVNVSLARDGLDFPVMGLSTGPVTVLTSVGNIVSYSVGDVNGDGPQDLVMMSGVLHNGSNFLGAIQVVYGFQPLTHPFASMRGREETSATAMIDLDVEGDPVDVRFSGDVGNAWLDQWVPFQSVISLRLSPEQGEKNIRVTFRNRFQRESETLALTAGALNPSENPSRMLTNILRSDAAGGGKMTVECPVLETTRLRAAVYDRQGRRLVQLVDEERPAGVWSIEWNGLNEEGRRVAPGIYILCVETNGRMEKHKIVIQG